MTWRSALRYLIGGVFVTGLLLSAGTLQASDTGDTGPDRAQIGWAQSPSDCADGDVIYSDQFSNPDSGWMVNSGFGFDWGYATDDQEYRVFLTSAGFVAWSESPMPAGSMPDKFCIESDVKHRVTGSLTDFGELGLILFSNGESTRHFFELAPSNGIWQISRNDGGTWTRIRGWTASSAVRGVNQDNKIHLIYNGEQMAFYINNSFAASFAMGKPENAGVFAGTFDEPNMNGRFDDFKVIRLSN